MPSLVEIGPEEDEKWKDYANDDDDNNDDGQRADQKSSLEPSAQVS